MNESSVSSPFMKALREALPGSVVVKHRDASMIGLPDCSVTYGSHVLWLEFKLFEYKKFMDSFTTSYDMGHFLLEEATKAAPTQRAMMNRMGAQAAALYVMWVKKTSVLVVNPVTGLVVGMPKTFGAVELVARMMKAWIPMPFPGA